MFWTTYGRDPLDEFRQLQRHVNRLFEDRAVRTSSEFPTVNLWEGEDEYTMTAELPGITPEELEVTVVGDTVTLRGTRAPVALAEGEIYHRNERGSGQFARSVKLPKQIDAGKVKAQYSRGILQLSLPRAEAEKPRRITLKSS